MCQAMIALHKNQKARHVTYTPTHTYIHTFFAFFLLIFPFPCLQCAHDDAIRSKHDDEVGHEEGMTGSRGRITSSSEKRRRRRQQRHMHCMTGEAAHLLQEEIPFPCCCLSSSHSLFAVVSHSLFLQHELTATTQTHAAIHLIVHPLLTDSQSSPRRPDGQQDDCRSCPEEHREAKG